MMRPLAGHLRPAESHEMALSRVSTRLDQVLRASPAQPLFLRRASRRLVVLAYHDVASREGFARQIEYLREFMHPVSLDDVLSAIDGGATLLRRAVLVTFDDGDRSVFERAVPVMRRVGVPGVVFPVAGLIGTDRPFWWREVEALLARGGVISGFPPDDPEAAIRLLKRMPNDERLARIALLRAETGGAPVRTRQLRASELLAMKEAGFAVGNHTLEHPCLDRCSSETLEMELREAHAVLEEILGAPPVAFAWPNGNRDPRAAPVLEELGYRAAFLFDHRMGRFPPRHPYRISRVRVSSTTNPDRFRIIVSGLHSALHHVAGRR
jgi:peptidoglycan/xylan/chitin deacetylase (PgdA/CDA1 family)